MLGAAFAFRQVAQRNICLLDVGVPGFCLGFVIQLFVFFLSGSFKDSSEGWIDLSQLPCSGPMHPICVVCGALSNTLISGSCS